MKNMKNVKNVKYVKNMKYVSNVKNMTYGRNFLRSTLYVKRGTENASMTNKHLVPTTNRAFQWETITAARPFYLIKPAVVADLTRPRLGIQLQESLTDKQLNKVDLVTSSVTNKVVRESPRQMQPHKFGLRGRRLLPNGATQDDDNHAERYPMNLSPYARTDETNRKTDKGPRI